MTGFDKALAGQSRQTITVVQGEYAISDVPDTILSTILGSCVSVCLFDDVRGIGGMNHFLLPGTRQSDSANVKYGSNAMEILINELIKKGASRERLQAKMFGGGRMTVALQDIGTANVDFARSFLEREAIPCISESVGGSQARRVQFLPVTGAARQKFAAQHEVAETMPTTRPATVTSEIELF